MTRHMILQIFLVLFAGVVVGLVVFMLFLVSLPVLMVRPQLGKPVADKVAAKFQTVMVKMMVGGMRRNAPTNVG